MAIAARYKGYRYPIEVIGHAVWLYHRFALSLRDVEELMLVRGVVVTWDMLRERRSIEELEELLKERLEIIKSRRRGS